MKQSLFKIFAAVLVLGTISCASPGAGCYDFGNVDTQSGDELNSTIERNFIPKKNPDVINSEISCD